MAAEVRLKRCVSKGLVECSLCSVIEVMWLENDGLCGGKSKAAEIM